MKTIVVLGAGKIGRMVAHFLANHGGYELRIGDSSEPAVEHIVEECDNTSGSAINFTDKADLDKLMDGADAVISCAPYHCNPIIAEQAKQRRVHYFDLTEDVEVTKKVAALANGAESAFVPQCGLAPGFITITAVHLMNQMTDVSDLRMRVGALPRFPSNMLKYNLTWSTEGLINEYLQPCEAILNGELRRLQPMENLETITIDGVEYEGFNTSGGLGTLAESLLGKVKNVNYKSLRYPGHNYLMKFLLTDLRMQSRMDELCRIFDDRLPTTFQDQIVIFVSATGKFRGKRTEATYARTIYHQEIDGQNWSGIQITTAAGVCAVADMLLHEQLPQQGFVRQEDVDYTKFIANRFGKYYA